MKGGKGKGILAGIVVVLTGCSLITGPHIDGIEVTLSLSQEEMSVGDTVEIRILATNTTASQLDFITGVCDFFVRFVRLRKVVLTRPSACNSISHPHTLGPGESLERVVLFDGTVENYVRDPEGRSYNEPIPMEPGTYRLVAGLSQVQSLGGMMNQSDVAELRIKP